MKILIYYSLNDKEVKQSFNFDYYHHIQFTCVHNKVNFYKNYEQQHYDIVIINLSSQYSKQILNHIVKCNAKQKIIVMCNDLNQCISFDCHFCNEYLNIQRVLNSIELRELIRFINVFNKKGCPYFDNIEDSTLHLEELAKKFIFYKLNTDKNMLIRRESSVFQLAELLDIVAVLNKYNINHSINEDENILIQK